MPHQDFPALPALAAVSRSRWAGLAFLVFALLALETLGDVADEAVTVIGVTVLLSVVAHGLSAAPLSERFERASGAQLTRNHGEL